MKNRWSKNFTQKGDVKHNSNFQNIFENQGILFFKNGQKKESQKKRQTFQNEGFFFVQKSGEDEKNWRCES